MTYQQLRALLPDDAQSIDWNGLLVILPELEALSRTPQDPAHHAEGDVWIHTRMVCEVMIGLPDYQQADADRRFVLFYSSLLHDIAKPACTVLQDDGRISSAGHSRRGEIDTRLLLWRAGVPFALREQICRIIAVHQLPFYAFTGNRSNQSPEFIVRKLSWEVCIRDLAAVAEADMRGRLCTDQDQTLEAIELFRELARDEGCFETARAFPDAATRIAYFRSEGGVSPDHAFWSENGSRVVVLCGMPASGKDTWIMQHGAGCPVISFDDVIEELGVKHGTDAAGKARHLAIDRAKILLRNKSPFIWNATHLSRQMRQKTLDLLYRYAAEVRIVYLEAPEKEIRRRNNARDTTLTNHGIEKMLHRWEVPLPSEVHEISYSVNDDTL